MYVPVFTVDKKTFSDKHTFGCHFYSIVFDIFLSTLVTGRLISSENLLDHPSVNSGKDGIQEQSPHDAFVIHPHCLIDAMFRLVVLKLSLL